jgi:hypothetical protein
VFVPSRYFSIRGSDFLEFGWSEPYFWVLWEIS